MGHSRLLCIGVVGLTGLILSITRNTHSQDKKAAPKKAAAIAPAEKLAEGWDAIDERLIFLMIRLANTETSLEAVENAIAKATGKKSVKAAEAKKADRENEAMDRKGGGPTRWSTFYGTTAEKFFYHPTDRNSTYHTVTVLSQQGPRADNKVGGGVPAGQGLPVHQRPPQFDYIYRANEKAKDRAESEAAQFKGKIEELLERRQRLEAEQAGLWCEIAFRAVAHYDLHKKPIYRFEPLLVKQDDPTSKQHAEVMKSAAVFMRLALSIIDAAQKDQATTFSGIKTAVSEAREKLDDTLLRQGVDASDKKTTEGRFAALAKRLDDVASNLSDSYEVAAEGDKEKDQQRKDTFRGLLQESLVNYAQVILALDEMSVLMKDEWMIKPDLDKPLIFTSGASLESVRVVKPKPADSPSGNDTGSADRPLNAPPQGFVALFNGKDLTNWRERKPGHWTVINGILQYDGQGDSLITAKQYRNFELYVDWKISPGGDSGIFLRGKPQVQIWDSPVGSGGLYNNRTNPKTPVNRADNPVGEWNTFLITMSGERVTVLLNGEKVVDDVVLENWPNYDGRLPMTGTIELQHHKSPLLFRNIFIKELKAAR